MWEWYFDLSDSVRRVRDGVCEAIPPSEFLAWRLLGEIDMRGAEYDILRAMDLAFCDEMNKELADYQARQQQSGG